MIYINKGKEPEWLSIMKEKNPKLIYDDKKFTSEYKEELKEQLVKEQKGLCAYCCSKISTETSHIEHIEPRHLKTGAYSKKSLRYDNLVASCAGFHGEKTCGSSKGNEYDETRFVSPLNSKCEEKFSYYPNGEINGDKYTIEVLNLDSYQLRKAREAVYKSIMYMEKEDIIQIYMNEETEEYMPFMDVIKWYINSLDEGKK